MCNPEQLAGQCLNYLSQFVLWLECLRRLTKNGNEVGTGPTISQVILLREESGQKSAAPLGPRGGQAIRLSCYQNCYQTRAGSAGNRPGRV
jgi:hypothetical protein